VEKANIKISFSVYVGLMAFTSIVAGVVAFALSVLTLLFLNFQIMSVFGIAALVGVLTGVFSIVMGYLYPMYVAYSRGSKIDANLPMIANFMSVLASAGVPPEAIFRSLARVGKEFNVDKEASAMIGETELGGVDLHTALKRASERSPSRQFAGMIDGVVTTSHMGGDLAGYLRDEADKFKSTRMLKMKRFLDNLAVIAETYVTFVVALPLALIVMLSVMAFMGGGVMIGNLDPGLLLNLVTFVIMPAGVAVMILAVDNMSPQR
jgi:flagellar protein FlaJ